MLLFLVYWLLIVVHVLHCGAGSLENCTETRCNHLGPAIRFPFRVKGRQPRHCGYKGFDLSCTNDNQTLLEIPSSAYNKLFVYMINYTDQRIKIYDPNGCLRTQVLNLSLSSSPFESKSRDCTTFSCPSSIERDRHSNISGCLVKLSCLGNNPGHQIFAVHSSDDCSIDSLPLLSCTKVRDYSSVPSILPEDNIRNLSTQNDILDLYWSIRSCDYCQRMEKKCRLHYKYQSVGREFECYLPLPKPPPPKGSHNGRASLKVLGISTLSVVAIAMLSVIYYFYSSNKTEKESQRRIERYLDDYKAQKPSRYSYADIKRITNQFKEKLGQGAYGSVFKGTLSTELLVAVKILNNSNEKGEDFINEVGTMGRIHHLNVVRMVGFCADGYIRALVYEFLPNGSLQNFLSSADDKSSFLGWDKLQEIALGIAKGIEYLHQGCDQRILHFDIKPHNILLDQNFTPKVSDFGLAKLCSKDQSAISMTTARGTIGYIAPEVFSRNFGNVSYKSDVYSFGILLLEMVGGRKNFKIMEDSTREVYFPEWIYNLLEQGNDLRIHIEDEGDAKFARKLAIVGLWCIQWHPIDRPSMKVVVQMLEREGDNLTMPPNPFSSTSN
ncbi:putative glycerophosphodiester phosphodiesterase, protein kinase RLK-Pelle-LRK10L-2 family [Rosa chinensis]|uniref:Putative glycerophosphodiester phosphodiesterase, protein kinase RLK-Pelle-LRK10L-2 family n=2 Tax=Rosa chinensis TaxID=74649 RepID=A0A2P6S9Y4_ROSCH|nr:putative glycerophosphodiester phosphodiesterase, protein kinase RLK-Pelle-LRK10L-2 family [Rosa chinensis]